VNLQNHEYEKILLGHLISDSALLDSYKILENFFTTVDHKSIFNAIKDLKNDGYDIDIISVTDKSKVNHVYVSELSCVSTANFKYYYDSLEELKNLRGLVKINTEALNSIHSGKEYASVASDIENGLYTFDSEIEYDITAVKDALPTVIQELEDICTGKKDWGIKHGIRSLNEYLIGFMASQLIIIGARPSQGKTAFMLQLTINISQHYKCGIISLETTKEALTKRILSNLSCVNLKEVNHSTRSAFNRLTDASDILSNRQIDIYDPPSATIDDIRMIVRRMKKNGCRIVFIDYLTLINNNNGDSRTERVADTSTALKQIARINEIPLVCLSQIKRDSDGRRPRLSDFVWSAQVEQDADIAIMLYPKTKDENDHDKYNIDVEVIIGKQKDGPTGSTHLRFAQEYQRFDEYI
jgi:replicative DNA helicase